MSGDAGKKAETWRDWCKHYGGCVTHGNRDLCTVPDDPAYIAEREARERRTPPETAGDT